MLIKWKELDEPLWEPMETIKEDNPVTLAEYARNNGIHKKAVWKWSKRYLFFSKAGKAKIAQINAKKNKKRGPKFKFGQKVSRNHACDLVIRRSLNGILLIFNLTPAKWYSKRQNTVETLTFGFE